MQKPLLDIYAKLYKNFGPQHWWPGESRFEILLGAILTQNTNWQNVEKTIVNLKQNKSLNIAAIKKITYKRLAELIRSSGYYNIKAQRIKNFIKFIFYEYNGNLSLMSETNSNILRNKLLSVKGIGPETADSILLYGFNKPVFVVDAYTKRIFSRHNIINKNSTYEQIQQLFKNNLPKKAKLFNEYHALLVKLGKEYCRKTPNCIECPLNSYKL